MTRQRFSSLPIAMLDFNHLTLAEVAEHERLQRIAQTRVIEGAEARRLTYLTSRRVCPPRERAEDGAA